MIQSGHPYSAFFLSAPQITTFYDLQLAGEDCFLVHLSRLQTLCERIPWETFRFLPLSFPLPVFLFVRAMRDCEFDLAKPTALTRSQGYPPLTPASSPPLIFFLFPRLLCETVRDSLRRNAPPSRGISRSFHSPGPCQPRLHSAVRALPLCLHSLSFFLCS